MRSKRSQARSSVGLGQEESSGIMTTCSSIQSTTFMRKRKILCIFSALKKELLKNFFKKNLVTNVSPAKSVVSLIPVSFDTGIKFPQNWYQ
jgi:hypothetical protein